MARPNAPQTCVKSPYHKRVWKLVGRLATKASIFSYDKEIAGAFERWFSNGTLEVTLCGPFVQLVGRGIKYTNKPESNLSPQDRGKSSSIQVDRLNE